MIWKHQNLSSKGDLELESWRFFASFHLSYLPGINFFEITWMQLCALNWVDPRFIPFSVSILTDVIPPHFPTSVYQVQYTEAEILMGGKAWTVRVIKKLVKRYSTLQKEVKVPRGSSKTAFKEAKFNLCDSPLQTRNAYTTEFQFKYVIPVSTNTNRVRLWNPGIYNS